MRPYFFYRRIVETRNAVKAFGALAQETRLAVLKLLAGAGSGGLPAGDISLALGVPQNTLSFHLSHMEHAGLIRRRRAGRFIIYTADPEGLKGVLRYLMDNCMPTTKTGA